MSATLDLPLQERELFCDAPSAEAALTDAAAWIGDGAWVVSSAWQRKDGRWQCTLLGPVDLHAPMSPAVAGVPTVTAAGELCWLRGVGGGVAAGAPGALLAV